MRVETIGRNSVLGTVQSCRYDFRYLFLALLWLLALALPSVSSLAGK